MQHELEERASAPDAAMLSLVADLFGFQQGPMHVERRVPGVLESLPGRDGCHGPYSTRSMIGSGRSPRNSNQAFFAHG